MGQGFEVKILEGARELLASGMVNAWKFEVGLEFLISQGTSAAEYINLFMKHGYLICGKGLPTNFPGGDDLESSSDEDLRMVACSSNMRLNVDFIAKRVR